MEPPRNTGFVVPGDPLRASSRQLFQAIPRQAPLAGLRVSISAFKASGVAGFLSAAGDGWVQAKPTNTTEHTTIVRLRMLFPWQLACGKDADSYRRAQSTLSSPIRSQTAQALDQAAPEPPRAD